MPRAGVGDRSRVLLRCNVGSAVANVGRKVYDAEMDEGRKRVIGIIAGIIVPRNLERADDLFGGPQGSPRTDKMIAPAVQWADRIMQKIDNVYSDEKPKSVAQKA
jgi:hypothetical protein